MASNDPSQADSEMFLANNLETGADNDGIADPSDIAIDLCICDFDVKTSKEPSEQGANTDCNRLSSQEDIARCQEEVFAHHISSGDENSYKFHSAVGILEDILVSEQFSEIQSQFFEQYYDQFDYDEENKLVYMDIFQQYQATVEGYIEAELKSQVPEFSMEWFSKMMDKNQEFVDMGIYEILQSFGDFLAFKELMLRYKGEKDGNALDLSDLIMTSSYRV